MVTEEEVAAGRQQVLHKCARLAPTVAIFTNPTEAVCIAVQGLVTEGLAEVHEYKERGATALAVRLTETGRNALQP